MEASAVGRNRPDASVVPPRARRNPAVTTHNDIVMPHRSDVRTAMCYPVAMTTSVSPYVTALTPGEREYIRRELDQFFSTLPTAAEGFQLRTWRGGPQKGNPKLPPAAKSLVDRGLMRLDASPTIPRLFFTEAGIIALRQMMADRRLADPVKFAHIRRELGIDPDMKPGVAAE